MKVVWLAVVLSLTPGIAAAQSPLIPPQPQPIQGTAPTTPGAPSTIPGTGQIPTAPGTTPTAPGVATPTIPGAAGAIPAPGGTVPGAPLIPGTTQTIPGGLQPLPETAPGGAVSDPAAPGTTPTTPAPTPAIPVPTPGTVPGFPSTPPATAEPPTPGLPPGSQPSPWPLPPSRTVTPTPATVPPLATTPTPSRVIGPTLPPLPGPGAVGAPVQAPGLIIGTPPGGGFPVNVSPRLPPPATIPSGPSVILPMPPASGQPRPTRLLDFRPSLQVSEEWSDNFNRSERNRVSNFRSTIIPGVQVLLDSGPFTGSAAYNLSAFHDSSVGEFGFQNSVAALLAWQVLPTWRLALSESFLESDDPERTDRLLLTRQRRDTSSNQTALTSDYDLLALGLDTRQYYRFSQFSSDRTTSSHVFGLGASRALDRIHVVSVGYEYLTSETTASRTATSATANRNTSTSGHQLTASFSRDISKLMTAGITGSYATRERDATTGPSSFDRWSLQLFSNYTLQDLLFIRSSIGVSQLSTGNEPLLTSTTSISYWMGPATLTLGIEQGFSETFGETEDFGVVETSGLLASVLYRFSPLLTGELTGQYRENNVTGIEGTAGGVNARGDTTYTFGLTLTYLITRGLTASLEATHTESEGRGARSFTENRIRAVVGAILY